VKIHTREAFYISECHYDLQLALGHRSPTVVQGGGKNKNRAIAGISQNQKGDKVAFEVFNDESITYYVSVSSERVLKISQDLSKLQASTEWQQTSFPL